MNKDITLENLDLSCIEYSDCICYRKGIIDEYIWFYKISKTVEITIDSITMEELQAIYNKCKELGWLND